MTFLKLRWARFFTLAGWSWKLAPQHTGADFIVKFRCGHSQCPGSHTLAVRICEKSGDALTRKHREIYSGRLYDEPSPALFGDGPENTTWEMVHGVGGGTESAINWADDAVRLWKRAAYE